MTGMVMGLTGGGGAENEHLLSRECRAIVSLQGNEACKALGRGGNQKHANLSPSVSLSVTKCLAGI